jgi:type IV pilus assembly protein PilE
VPDRGRREAGVTLIELMTVMAIVGILAAIAYPAYTQFVMQTNRTDATKTMQQAAQALERCYSVNFTYAPAGGCSVLGTLMNLGANPPLPSPNNYYAITLTITDAQDYTITAAATAAPQTADNQCWSFSLASSGQQTAQDNNNNDTTKLCWGSN